MASGPERAPDAPLDLGAYCREVEEHLARLNQGHIIRIVGTAFELVRGWALEGIPLAIVRRGIEQKVERHRAGRSTRPLRLEFCEADVRAAYDDWKRAVGLQGSGHTGEAAPLPPAIAERRRPSVTRQLDRAIDRVTATTSRLDLPDGVPAAFAGILDDLVALRDQVRRTRGVARQALSARVTAVDEAIGVAARRAAGDTLQELEEAARRELAPFRERMAPDAWDRSVRASADRLLRERWGLPILDVDLSSTAADQG